MEIIHIEGSEAILEGQDYFYRASFTLDEESGSVEIDSLEYSDTLEDEGAWEWEGRNTVCDAIAREIEDYFSTEEEPDEQSELCELVLCRRPSGYSLKIRMGSDLTFENEVGLIASGDFHYLKALSEPMREFVSMYAKVADDADADRVRSLCLTVVDLVGRLLPPAPDGNESGGPDSETWQSVLDRVVLKMWVQAMIANTANKVLVANAKRLLKEYGPTSWLSVREAQVSVFDSQAFRVEHPELYEKYKKTISSAYLVKARRSTLPEGLSARIPSYVDSLLTRIK